MHSIFHYTKKCGVQHKRLVGNKSECSKCSGKGEKRDSSKETSVRKTWKAITTVHISDKMQDLISLAEGSSFFAVRESFQFR